MTEKARVMQDIAMIAADYCTEHAVSIPLSMQVVTEILALEPSYAEVAKHGAFRLLVDAEFARKQIPR
jgi:hypothetical protein